MHLKIGWLISLSHSRRLDLLQFYGSCAEGCNRTQEAPPPRRAQRVRRAYLVYVMAFIGRQSTDQQLINHFYVTGHESYRIPRNHHHRMARR